MDDNTIEQFAANTEAFGLSENEFRRNIANIRQQDTSPADVSGSDVIDLPDTPQSNVFNTLNLAIQSQLDQTALSNASAISGQPEETELQGAQKGFVMSALDALRGTVGKGGIEDFTREQREDLDFEGKEEALNQINKDLASEKRALDISKRELFEGGLTKAQVNVQSQELTRVSLQKQADLALLQSAANGDINTANNILQQRLEVEFGDELRTIENSKQALELISPLLSREERQQADAQQLFLDERARLLQEEADTKERIGKLKIELAKKGLISASRELDNFSDYESALNFAIGTGGLSSGSGVVAAGIPGFLDENTEIDARMLAEELLDKGVTDRTELMKRMRLIYTAREATDGALNSVIDIALGITTAPQATPTGLSSSDLGGGGFGAPGAIRTTERGTTPLTAAEATASRDPLSQISTEALGSAFERFALDENDALGSLFQ